MMNQSPSARGFQSDRVSFSLQSMISSQSVRGVRIFAVVIGLQMLAVVGIADDGMIRSPSSWSPGFSMEIIPKGATQGAPNKSSAGSAGATAQARRVTVPDASRITNLRSRDRSGIPVSERAEQLRANLNSDDSTDDVSEMALPLIRRTAQRMGAIPTVPKQTSRLVKDISSVRTDSTSAESQRVQLPNLPFSASESQDRSQGMAAYPAQKQDSGDQKSVAAADAPAEDAPRMVSTAAYPETTGVVYDIPEWKPHSPGHSLTASLPSRNSREFGEQIISSSSAATAAANYPNEIPADSPLSIPSVAFYPPGNSGAGTPDLSGIASTPAPAEAPPLSVPGYTIPVPSVVGTHDGIAMNPATAIQPPALSQAPAVPQQSGVTLAPGVPQMMSAAPVFQAPMMQAPMMQAPAAATPPVMPSPMSIPGYAQMMPLGGGMSPQMYQPQMYQPQMYQPQMVFPPADGGGMMPVPDPYGQQYAPQGYGYAIAPPTPQPGGGMSLGGMPLYNSAPPSWLPKNSSRPGGLYGGRYGGNGNITKVPSSRYAGGLASAGSYRGAGMSQTVPKTPTADVYGSTGRYAR